MGKIPASGEIYRDFAGKPYRIVTMAGHAETGEEFVVYQALEGDCSIFVLPLTEFGGAAEEKNDRFVLIEAPKLIGSGAGSPGRADVAAFADAPEKSGPGECDRKEGGLKKGGQEESSLKEGAPEEGGLDAGLLAFLEAETYEEKLKVYASLAGRADEHMLNTIAVSMDLELSGGSVEEQYDNLKSCLLTLERYECSRLR